jgi:hypothetical protein
LENKALCLQAELKSSTPRFRYSSKGGTSRLLAAQCTVEAISLLGTSSMIFDIYSE